MIVEATYGVSRHLPREGREQRFVSMIRAVVQRGGRCLVPIVALGRAQARRPPPPPLPVDLSPQNQENLKTLNPPLLAAAVTCAGRPCTVPN